MPSQRPHIGPSATLGQVVGLLRVGELAISGQVPTVAAADMPLHTHTEAHFILVTRGDYCSAARGFDGALPALIFNPPGTEHRDCFAPTQRLADAHFYAVWIGPRRWAALRATLSPPAQPVACSGPHVAGLAGQLAEWLAVGEAVRDPQADDTAIDNLLLELFAAAEDMPAADGAARWIADARQLLDRHVDQGIRIAALAARFELHPVYFARAFRHAAGVAPTEYHLRRRLEHAAALLAEGALNVAAVASSTGFADQAHLSRHFSAAYGIAPARYRERLARASA